MAEETSDIYRMNKLLEIEHADWVRQLEQAVSPPRGFLFHFLSQIISGPPDL